MTTSRVKVGRPMGALRSRPSGAMKWNGAARSRKESPPRIRLVRTSFSPAEEQRNEQQLAATDIAAPPLSFLSFRNFLILAGVALVMVVLVLGLVRSNHRSLELGYDIYTLTQKKNTLMESNRALSAELTRITALGQLEDAARNSLGMITPQQGQIVVID